MQCYRFPPEPSRYRYRPNWWSILLWAFGFALFVAPVAGCVATFFHVGR